MMDNWQPAAYWFGYNPHVRLVRNFEPKPQYRYTKGRVTQSDEFNVEIRPGEWTEGALLASDLRPDYTELMRNAKMDWFQPPPYNEVAATASHRSTTGGDSPAECHIPILDDSNSNLDRPAIPVSFLQFYDDLFGGRYSGVIPDFDGDLHSWYQCMLALGRGGRLDLRPADREVGYFSEFHNPRMRDGTPSPMPYAGLTSDIYSSPRLRQALANCHATQTLYRAIEKPTEWKPPTGKYATVGDYERTHKGWMATWRQEHPESNAAQGDIAHSLILCQSDFIVTQTPEGGPADLQDGTPTTQPETETDVVERNLPPFRRFVAAILRYMDNPLYAWLIPESTVTNRRGTQPIRPVTRTKSLSVERVQTRFNGEATVSLTPVSPGTLRARQMRREADSESMVVNLSRSRERSPRPQRTAGLVEAATGRVLLSPYTGSEVSSTARARLETAAAMLRAHTMASRTVIRPAPPVAVLRPGPPIVSTDEEDSTSEYS